MPRRERSTIVGELLRHLADLELKDAATTTRLASLANVPYDRFLAYLQDLRERGLVEPTDPLRLTPLGRQFLARYLDWLEAMRLLGLGH